MDWTPTQVSMVVGAISLVIGFSTIAAAVWKTVIEQRQANKKPFLEKQLQLCFEATEIASRLASEVDPIEWEKARQAFWRLYWGPLSIVEDESVEIEMVRLGKLLPYDKISTPNLPMSALRDPAFELSRAARHLVLKSWKIRLPELQGTNQ